MDAGVWIVMIVIGVPVIGGLAYAAFEEVLKSRMKLQKLKVEEQRLKAEHSLRADELNAKILRMDDMGISPGEIASLREEVRQLREEMARIRQDINTRAIG